MHSRKLPKNTYIYTMTSGPVVMLCATCVGVDTHGLRVVRARFAVVATAVNTDNPGDGFRVADSAAARAAGLCKGGHLGLDPDLMRAWTTDTGLAVARLSAGTEVEADSQLQLLPVAHPWTAMWVLLRGGALQAAVPVTGDAVRARDAEDVLGACTPDVAAALRTQLSAMRVLPRFQSLHFKLVVFPATLAAISVAAAAAKAGAGDKLVATEGPGSLSEGKHQPTEDGLVGMGVHPRMDHFTLRRVLDNDACCELLLLSSVVLMATPEAAAMVRQLAVARVSLQPLVANVVAWLGSCNKSLLVNPEIPDTFADPGVGAQVASLLRATAALARRAPVRLAPWFPGGTSAPVGCVCEATPLHECLVSRPGPLRVVQDPAGVRVFDVGTWAAPSGTALLPGPSGTQWPVGLPPGCATVTTGGLVRRGALSQGPVPAFTTLAACLLAVAEQHPCSSCRAAAVVNTKRLQGAVMDGTGVTWVLHTSVLLRGLALATLVLGPARALGPVVCLRYTSPLWGTATHPPPRDPAQLMIRFVAAGSAGGVVRARPDRIQDTHWVEVKQAGVAVCNLSPRLAATLAQELTTGGHAAVLHASGVEVSGAAVAVAEGCKAKHKEGGGDVHDNEGQCKLGAVICTVNTPVLRERDLVGPAAEVGLEESVWVTGVVARVWSCLHTVVCHLNPTLVVGVLSELHAATLPEATVMAAAWITIAKRCSAHLSGVSVSTVLEAASAALTVTPRAGDDCVPCAGPVVRALAEVRWPSLGHHGTERPVDTTAGSGEGCGGCGGGGSNGGGVCSFASSVDGANSGLLGFWPDNDAASGVDPGTGAVPGLPRVTFATVCQFPGQRLQRRRRVCRAAPPMLGADTGPETSTVDCSPTTFRAQVLATARLQAPVAWMGRGTTPAGPRACVADVAYEAALARRGAPRELHGVLCRLCVVPKVWPVARVWCVAPASDLKWRPGPDTWARPPRARFDDVPAPYVAPGCRAPTVLCAEDMPEHGLRRQTVLVVGGVLPRAAAGAPFVHGGVVGGTPLVHTSITHHLWGTDPEDVVSDTDHSSTDELFDENQLSGYSAWKKNGVAPVSVPSFRGGSWLPRPAPVLSGGGFEAVEALCAQRKQQHALQRQRGRPKKRAPGHKPGPEAPTPESAPDVASEDVFVAEERELALQRRAFAVCKWPACGPGRAPWAAFDGFVTRGAVGCPVVSACVTTLPQWVLSVHPAEVSRCVVVIGSSEAHARVRACVASTLEAFPGTVFSAPVLEPGAPPGEWVCRPVTGAEVASGLPHRDTCQVGHRGAVAAVGGAEALVTPVQVMLCVVEPPAGVVAPHSSGRVLPSSATAPTWTPTLETWAAFRHATLFLTSTSVLVVLTPGCDTNTVTALLCPPGDALRALAAPHTTTELGAAQLSMCLKNMQPCNCGIKHAE